MYSCWQNFIIILWESIIKLYFVNVFILGKSTTTHRKHYNLLYSLIQKLCIIIHVGHYLFLCIKVYMIIQLV